MSQSYGGFVHVLVSHSCRERAVFRVLCTKGTYVRTICHDLGQRLGCGGCMSALRRTRAGGFGIGRAFTMEQILAGEAEILPVDSVFADRPAVTQSLQSLVP